MVDLKQAIIDNEKTNHKFGLTFEQLANEKQYHRKKFYDKWGIPWKYMKGILYYSDDTYPKKRHRWNEAYMEGPELPYKRFFTPEEFEKIKPGCLR